MPKIMLAFALSCLLCLPAVAANGVIDVKSYHVESPDEVASRVRSALEYAPADKLVFAPDCGLSQTARWASRKKLASMVEGCAIVRKELGLD